MLNLIKMDMYRMVRTVSFWVLCIVAAAMAIFSVYMTEVEMSAIRGTSYAEQSESFQDTQSEDALTIGVYVDTDPAWAEEKIPYIDLVSKNLSGMMVLLLCAIFPPLFVNAEQKHGYIKNIAGQLPRRGMLVLSKLAVIAIQVLALFVVFMLAIAATGLIIWGNRLVFDDFGKLMGVVAVQYLLHFAFSAVVSAITVATRITGICMTFGILVATGFMQMLYYAVNYQFETNNINFNIMNYMLDCCVGQILPTAESGDIIRIIVVGAAYLMISAVASVIIMQKRDVR